MSINLTSYFTISVQTETVKLFDRFRKYGKCCPLWTTLYIMYNHCNPWKMSC